MKRLLLLLALCLALFAGFALAAREDPEASLLTVEEAREALAQVLLERNDSYLPMTGKRALKRTAFTMFGAISSGMRKSLRSRQKIRKSTALT